MLGLGCALQLCSWRYPYLPMGENVPVWRGPGPAGRRAEGQRRNRGRKCRDQAGGTLAGDLAVVGGNARIEAPSGLRRRHLAVPCSWGPRRVCLGMSLPWVPLSRHPDALVQGSVIAGAEAARRAAEPGGVLRGESGASPPIEGANGSGLGNTVLGVLRWLATLVGFLVLRCLPVSLFPGPIDHYRRGDDELSGIVVLMGLVTLVACVILVPLVAITIIGIPLSLALIVALVWLAWRGWSCRGAAAGFAAPQAVAIGRAARAALGVALLVLLSGYPVGWALTLAAVCWGLGAVVLTRFGTSRDRLWEPFASLGSQAPSGRMHLHLRPPGARVQCL